MKTYGEIHGHDENDWRSKNILQCGVSMLLYQQMGSCQNRKYKEMARHTIWSGGDDQDIEQESGKVGEGGQKPVNMGKLRKMNPAEFSSAWFHHPLWCLWTLGESSGWWLGCAATSDGGYYGECPAHIEQALTWNMVQHDLLVQPSKSGPETIFLLESSLISKMLQALPQEGLCLNPIEGQLWDASSLFRLHQNFDCYIPMNIYEPEEHMLAGSPEKWRRYKVRQTPISQVVSASYVHKPSNKKESKSVNLEYKITILDMSNLCLLWGLIPLSRPKTV